MATVDIIADIKTVFEKAKVRLATISDSSDLKIPNIDVPRKLTTYLSQDYLPEKKQVQDFEHPAKEMLSYDHYLVGVM